MMSPLLKTPPALPAASRGALAFLLKSLIMLSVCGALQAQAPLRYNISEQVPSGTFVGNIRFDSRLASRYETAVFEQLRYSFLDPSEENVHRFSIDAITGILRTEGVLDREDFCAQRLSCVVNLDIAVGPRQYFQVIGVTVTVLDVNDRRPEFPQESITLEIAESASAGAIYKLPEAEDLDSGRFGIQGYRMETDFDDTFQLNVIEVGGRPSKIQLKLLKSLDREERDFYRVNIIAFDGGEPPELGVLEVNIAVGDANDHGPRFLNSTYRVVIPESARPQASVVRVSAEDEDIGKNGEIRYSFSDNDHDDVFAIDAESGEITLKGTLDYEKQQRYVLTVEAADGGVNSQPAYATVTVDVMDMNDNPPQISVNTLSAGASETAVVSELAQVGDMVAYISVKDPDSGLAGQFLCRLNEPHFRLEQTQPTKFKVVTAGPLDRERQDEYALVIECQDQGNPALVTTETIVVKVLDENDNAPIFPISTYYVELKENNHVKAWILQVNATEKDSGRNGEVRYALGQDAHDQFTIDPLSGVVRANAVFDYEQTDQVIFSVIAYDLGDPAQSTTATVVLSILDTNDEPPRFTEDSYRFNVRENQPVGIEIGMVSASDADSDHNNRIEYAMLPSKSAELFTVDTQTGQVRSKAQLDREEPGQALYHVTVIANNVGVTPPLSGSATVTIEVLDENDNAPIIDYPNSLNNTLYISSQVPLGYGIGPLQAHDLDVGDNAKLTFHVSGGNENGAFVIDPDTGMIETNIKLHDYDQKTFSVEVSVMDHGFPQHISKQMLHIVVNKSIAFAYEEQKSMLSTTNITIVVSLSVASVVVIIILVIAIVAVRRKGRRKQQQHVYRCRVEAQKRVADMKKDSAAGGGSRRSSVASSGSSGKQQNKKEVSFRLQKEGPGAPTSAEKKSLWPGAAGVNRSKCDVSTFSSHSRAQRSVATLTHAMTVNALFVKHLVTWLMGFQADEPGFFSIDLHVFLHLTRSFIVTKDKEQTERKRQVAVSTTGKTAQSQFVIDWVQKKLILAKKKPQKVLQI